ncbi:hypothetical protein INT48_002779, partial [Thamnidium elegans]
VITMSSLNDAFWNEKEEADCIIDSYDNTTSLFAYKAAWCHKIGQVLNDLNVSYSSTKSNWECIAMAINDKRFGLRSYAPQANINTNINGSDSSRTTTPTAIAVSSSSEPSITSKQLKLCSDDKEKIKNLFDSLDESKKWKLSTGTILEEKMKEFALNCIYEQ